MKSFQVFATNQFLLVVLAIGSAIAVQSETRTYADRERILGDGVSVCPLDFKKVRNYPWVMQTCQDFPPDSAGTTSGNTSSCCNALLSGIGMAEAQYLNETGIFRLADAATVTACMNDFQSVLESQGLKNKAVYVCFPENVQERFITNNSLCLNIQKRSDFERLVTPSHLASLHKDCAGNLLDLSECNPCVDRMAEVYVDIGTVPRNFSQNGQLMNFTTSFGASDSEVDGRYMSDCIYDVVLYTAGLATTYGAWSPSTAECIMAVSLNSGSSGHSNVAKYLLIGTASAFLSSLVGCLVFCTYWRRKKSEVRRNFMANNEILMKSLARPPTGLVQFSFKDVKAATNNFAPENLIGEGGFGSVFKGVMKDGLVIAVKRKNNCGVEGDAEFLNELEVISRVRHRNLVLLKGCCVNRNGEDGPQRLLVYDYMPNGSLHDFLFGRRSDTLLSWSDRRAIAVGMAKGLAYLHNDISPSIIHKDIKPSNVLLDEDFNARVSDFGLARLSDRGEEQLSSMQAGTRGYIAPEYALYGQMTEKSDVYSYGVVLLELMSGRRALDSSQQSTPNYAITEWCSLMAAEGKVLDIVDERIRGAGPIEKMEILVRVGILCTQTLVAFRPTFMQILKILQGELPIPTVPDRPLSSYDWPAGDSSDSHRFSSVVPNFIAFSDRELLR